jgi:CRISPR-associated protein Cmr3
VSWLEIRVRDPIIARDGRPFSATQRRMRSLDWPYPSVLAGSLRTLVAKMANLSFTAGVAERLRQIEIAGPLPMVEGELYFPKPADCVVSAEDGVRKCYVSRPCEMGGGGCNLPGSARVRGPKLLPAMLAAGIEDFKPAKTPAFWSQKQMTAWLVEEKYATPPDPDDAAAGGGFLNAPEQDQRTHVMIEAETGAARDRYLFQTSGLDLAESVKLAARSESADAELAGTLAQLDAMHPLGGERRVAHWTHSDGAAWEAPGRVVEALAKTKLVRMVLATPAVFSDGWRPGWVGEDLRCEQAGVVMRLKAVAIERWRPISGWNLERSANSKLGPKAIKRAVPAGGVYFFEVEGEGGAAELARRLWLRPVSDGEQDCRDGFGLALWGAWHT